MQKNYTIKEYYPSNEEKEICRQCKGCGNIPLTESCSYIKECPLCNGDGKVDWVRNAMGDNRIKNKNALELVEVWNNILRKTARKE